MKEKFYVYIPKQMGHYLYYLKVLQAYGISFEVVETNELGIVKYLRLIYKNRHRKHILLSAESILKKKPWILFLLNLFRCDYNQILYYVTHFERSGSTSVIFRLYFKFCSGKSRIKSFVITPEVSSKITNEYGLVVTTDPITEVSVEEMKSFPYQGINYLLLIGSHDKRKGTYDFLKRLKETDLEIIVAGKVYDERLKEIDTSTFGFKIRVIDQFLEEDLMFNLIQKAKCIVVPYINWDGSSGILGQSLLFDKVIMGTDNGTIGRILKEYEKSILIDQTDEEISITDSEINELEQVSSNAKQLLNKYYNPEIFIKDITS